MRQKTPKQKEATAKPKTRRVRYGVAMSLDGYIAGPKGEADWILMDPEIDFRALFSQFDVFLIGRRTYDMMKGGGSMGGKKSIVISRTLRPKKHPGVTISDDPAAVIAELRLKSGKDIALFGGGILFRSLLAARLVDTVEVAVIPVLLGGGIPLFPPPAKPASLRLTGHKVYRQTGTVMLEYAIDYQRAVGRRRTRKSS
jgi:dihydrofolate reductase